MATEKATAYRLRWAEGEEARMNLSGEWQLRFRDSAARDFAHQHLNLSEWLSFQKTSADEIVYTYLKSSDTSVVLDNLIKSGIPKQDIEIEKP
jgi:hypothetical protein